MSEKLKSSSEKYGYHISIKSSVLKSLQEYYQEHDFTIPVQIFTGSPISLQRRAIINSSEVKKYVLDNGIRLFVHSAYVLNLCSPATQALDYIEKELTI